MSGVASADQTLPVSAGVDDGQGEPGRMGRGQVGRDQGGPGGGRLPIKGCVFDMDGTLLDSMGVWGDVDRDFFAARGLVMPADYIETVIAMPYEELAAYTIERFDLPDSPGELMAEWTAMAHFAYTHTVQAKPGAVEYLRALTRHGLKLAVATSLPPDLRDEALDHAGIRDCFTAFCSTSDVSRGKVWPDIYLWAAGRLGIRPRQCVVFEDLLAGVCSAKAAGMTAWAVYDDSSAQQWEQIQAAADGVITDFNQAPPLWATAWPEDPLDGEADSLEDGVVVGRPDGAVGDGAQAIGELVNGWLAADKEGLYGSAN